MRIDCRSHQTDTREYASHNEEGKTHQNYPERERDTGREKYCLDAG